MAVKAETLINGIRNLAQTGQLDRQSMIAIGPKIGIQRGFYIPFGNAGESEAAYFERVQESIRTKEGLERFEKYYETLSSEGRRAIGKAIKEVRIRYS